MDGDQTQGGFVGAGLAQIPATLQAVVDAGDLSGFVTLVWRKGEIAHEFAGEAISKDRLLAAKDPIAVELFARYRGVRMPDLELSSGEISAILGYLEEQARPRAPVRNAAMP